MSLHPNEVLLAPVVSEKSYEQIESNHRYSFRVHQDAHKTQIRQAVEELFDVHVERVNVIQVRSKPKRRGLTKGRKPGWKKAIVQIKAGESIRSEERRVGKECRCRWARCHEKKTEVNQRVTVWQ